MEVQKRDRGRVPFYGRGHFGGRFSGRTDGFNRGRAVQVNRMERPEASGGVHGIQNIQIVSFGDDRKSRAKSVEKSSDVAGKSVL